VQHARALQKLIGAQVTFAGLKDADLSGARNLTQAELDNACGKLAALPSGLTLDKPCPPRR